MNAKTDKTASRACAKRSPSLFRPVPRVRAQGGGEPGAACDAGESRLAAAVRRGERWAIERVLDSPRGRARGWSAEPGGDAQALRRIVARRDMGALRRIAEGRP